MKWKDKTEGKIITKRHYKLITQATVGYKT
jgi:hypothetical protein